MTKLAFVLAPWAKQIRALKATPRSLADDLLVIATGPNHEQIVKKAYSTTLSYLHCIRAAISAKKCFTFSTEATTREELRDYFWIHISARIPTATSFRDLGGHLNFGRLQTPAILTQRILRASALCERLVQLPWSRESKIKIVLNLISPLAFYGAEAAPPTEKPLERLVVAIAKAISFYSTGSSNLLSNLLLHAFLNQLPTLCYAGVSLCGAS